MEVCKLFCSSLLREPSDDAIQVCVCLFISITSSPQNFSSKDGSTAVLSSQVVRDEKHKVDEALRYIKAKLAEARTLERRKVCCSLIIHTSTVQLSIPCSASENIHTLGINLCQPGI